MACAVSGKVPNIYWNAVSTDSLRQHALYTSLPPVHEVPIEGPESYRLVRQDDPLWADLHQGVLTTGLLNSALGFYEPAAAKRLGIGKGFVSHGALMHAWKHLQDPPFVPQRRLAAQAESVASQPGRISATRTGDVVARAKKCKGVATRGSQGVRMAWGTAQEGATLYALTHALPGSRILEAGLFLLDQQTLPPAWGFSKGDLPPLGASPDGLLWHPTGSCSAADIRGAEGSSEPPQTTSNSGGDATLDEIESALRKLELARTPTPHLAHPLSPEGWLRTRSEGLLEVLEVKNSSPFWMEAQSPGYNVSDRGPASQVPALWVAQLQMEMLAVGADSAVLASRSATKGMALFRVQRDETFLRLMLDIIRRLYSTYVNLRKPPPKDMFYTRSDYQALLTRTLAIARGASLLARIASPRISPAADPRSFLE